MKQVQNSQARLVSIMAILLFMFAWLSVNIYLPALPSLVHDFDTQAQALKASITLFLLGFAISQLFWGPLSEKYGRRMPLIFGLIVSSLGIIIAMFALNTWMFNLGRLVEAIGLGTAPVLGRAILIDGLEAVAFSTTMAYGTIVSNLMPALAPILGGHLMAWFGWRSIFAFLLLYSLVIAYLLIYKMKETHPALKPQLSIFVSFKHYFEVLRDRRFLGYLIPYILISGAMIGYYTVTPFLFINQLGISAQRYGYYSLITVCSYIVGAVVSRLFTGRLGIKGMVGIGLSVLGLLLIVLLLAASLFKLSLWVVLIPMAIYTFAAGIICPNSNSGAMHAMRHRAGSAAAVLGFMLYLVSGILSTIITHLSLESFWPLAIYFVLVIVLSVVAFMLMLRGKTHH